MGNNLGTARCNEDLLRCCGTRAVAGRATAECSSGSFMRQTSSACSYVTCTLDLLVYFATCKTVVIERKN